MSVDLERQLQEYFREVDVRQGDLSPQDILDRADDMQVIPGRGGRQPTPGRKWVAAAVAVLAVILIAVGIRLLPATDQTPDPADQPSTTSIATPTTAVSDLVHGWPDTTENAAGLYSWDALPCGSDSGSCFEGFVCAGGSGSCNAGFMHNGYGSGDVDIVIEVRPDGPISDDGARAVSIAGHDGIYRRINAQREEWIVDIEGTTITIGVTAEPGTSQADLAEAYAIIDSMRTELTDNRLGFRLVFTLKTDDWDSG